MKRGEKCMKKNIFFDDVREVPKGYDLVFRTVRAGLDYLDEHPEEEFDLVSMDYDLGSSGYTGLDFIKGLAERNTSFDRIQFHTSDRFGMRDMFFYLLKARESGKLTHDFKMKVDKVATHNGVERETDFCLFRDELGNYPQEWFY